MNGTQKLHQFLILCVAGSLAAPAAAQDPARAGQGLAHAYVADEQPAFDEPGQWLSFSLESAAAPLNYADVDEAEHFSLERGLTFQLPVTARVQTPATRNDALDMPSESEPAFALLFGKIARLLANGNMALGRGDLRSNSPDNRSGQWDDLLPAAYSNWNDRPDVDVGLSYAGAKRFSTSVGFAEKIGQQNDDPAVVGWFEYRF